MKNNYEPVNGVFRVQLCDPFEKFYCLVVPAPQYGESYRQFYLMCEGFGVVVDMFACECNDDDHAAELALNNATDYIEPNDYF